MARLRNYGVKTRKSPRDRSDDEISVSTRLADENSDLDPLWLVSSQRFARSLDSAWNPVIRDRVKTRRRNGGASKGRVLYIATDKTHPIALLTLHVPDTGPIQIMEVAIPEAAPDDHIKFMNVLIDAAEEASERLGRGDGAIAWGTNEETTAATARKLFGFTRKPKPATCDRDFYLVRQ